MQAYRLFRLGHLSNDQVSRLVLRRFAVRIDGPLLLRQKPPAQEAGVIGIFVHVWTKLGFEFERLVSGKSLDLTVNSDSFASEPNEEVTAPIWWRNIGRQYGPEPRGLVP